MGFCTTCGAQLAEGARFCPKCGTPAPGAGSIAPPPLAAPTTLDYTIQGDNLQVVRVRLAAGQELYAEAGKMLYKTPSVSWETRMSGTTLGEKLLGALKRKVMGESLFLTYFRANAAGEVGFAGSYPGPGANLGPAMTFGFLCAQHIAQANGLAGGSGSGD